MTDAVESRLTDVATVYEPPNRATATRTPKGDIDDSFPSKWTPTTGLACRVNAPRRIGVPNAGAGQPQVTTYQTISFANGTTISTHARVKITASLLSSLVGQVFDMTDTDLNTYALLFTIGVKVRA